MLSLLSRVWLFATLWTVAHQAPLSLGFYRQEHWSELPHPPLGMFLTQGSNLFLPHYRHILYCLEPPGRIVLNINQSQNQRSFRYWILWRKPFICALKIACFNKCWRGCEEKGNLLPYWWECKLVQSLWRIVWRLLKKLETTAIQPSNPTAGHTHQGNQNWKRPM